MNIRVQQKCPICDSSKQIVFCEPWVVENDPNKLYGAASGIRGTQRLVTCIDCEMIYESPRFDASTIIKGYEASNEVEHDSQYNMRVKSFLSALKKHSKKLPLPGSKVLDIGTAGGAFMEASNTYGYETFGLEPSADLVIRGKTRGLNIQQGTIENHNFQKNSFDMICLWDVIEHLADPKSALIKIKELLKADGILLINFPDIGTLQAKIAGKYFWWILSVHLHHFTRKSIKNLCSATGFQVFHFQRYWQMLEFGYLEKMAVHFKIPFSSLIYMLTPHIIRIIPIPYYASQTTLLARIAK